MERPTTALVALLLVHIPAVLGEGWLDDFTTHATTAMAQMGVKADDVKQYTEKVNGAFTSVQGTISNIVDKVDWKQLYSVAADKIKPQLKEGLPKDGCMQSIEIVSFSSNVTFDEGKLKRLKDFSVNVKIINETETEMNVEIKLEYEELYVQYKFKYKSLLLEFVCDIEKNGRLLLLQKNTYLTIYGRIPKGSTALNDLVKKGSCAIKIQELKISATGDLTLSRIKYFSSGIGYIKMDIEQDISRAKRQFQFMMVEAMKHFIEAEIRKIKLFCMPEAPKEQPPFDCSFIHHKKLV